MRRPCRTGSRLRCRRSRSAAPSIERRLPRALDEQHVAGGVVVGFEGCLDQHDIALPRASNRDFVCDMIVGNEGRILRAWSFVLLACACRTRPSPPTTRDARPIHAEDEAGPTCDEKRAAAVAADFGLEGRVTCFGSTCRASLTDDEARALGRQLSESGSASRGDPGCLDLDARADAKGDFRTMSDPCCDWSCTMPVAYDTAEPTRTTSTTKFRIRWVSSEFEPAFAAIPCCRSRPWPRRSRDSCRRARTCARR